MPGEPGPGLNPNPTEETNTAMLPPDITAIIDQGQLPADLDYSGSYEVFTANSARKLSIPDSEWESALDSIDMEDLFLEPPAAWHMITGPWDKLVTIKFTPGLSPDDRILISAVMYPAEGIHRETVSNRDNKLAQALICWTPTSEYSLEVVNRYLQTN